MIHSEGHDVAEFAPGAFFDLTDSAIEELFNGAGAVWEIVPALHRLTIERVAGCSQIRGHVMDGAYVSDADVVVEQDAVIEAGAFVAGPCYIGRGAQVRHGAYIRGDVILLDGAVLGHASEAKNSLLLPHAKAPHFAYVGDSVLGARANLGAGTKLSNLAINSTRDPITSRRRTISVWLRGMRYDTGLSKFGAIIGDDTSTGCNAVLNPGTLLGPRSLVYPNVSVPRGYYPEHSVLGSANSREHMQRPGEPG